MSSAEVEVIDEQNVLVSIVLATYNGEAYLAK
ncbi:MAG: hypothetical protein JWR18_3708, partial [Segetibacter sp.]|nr:hypothetical protein [Segetibacter sp.]